MSHSWQGAFPEQPSQPVELRPFHHNLPVQPTPLIGRRREVETACEMLRRPDVRLLTLTGPPGIGKTRLGIEIGSNLAGDFADGTYFVPLAPITEPGLVLPAVAQALRIKETPGLPLSQSLTSYLRDREILVVLDNFEQVISAATEVAELLPHCPSLKVLVTSRELLHIYGEYDYPVPPLDLPDPNRLPGLEALSQYEAVQLFIQRARAVNPSFELSNQNAHAVAEICLRLDGLPLAIELAAARTLVLPLEELLARLKSRLKLLTGGARNLPERQRNLQAAIDWSYNLLDPGEQVLFRRLGVFVGGCTLEAIDYICGDTGPEMVTVDGVTSLIGKSLLQRQEGVAAQDEGRSPRFVMLETIREYAAEKLRERAEAEELQWLHTRYFLEFAEKAEPELVGPHSDTWRHKLKEEYDNLRAALQWCLKPGAGPECSGLAVRGNAESTEGTERATIGLRLAGALGDYWYVRGLISEGRQWLEAALSVPAPAAQAVGPHTGVIDERKPSGRGAFAFAYAKALSSISSLAWLGADYESARSYVEQALQIARELSDRTLMPGLINSLGQIAALQGDIASARSLHEEGLAISREMGNKAEIASQLGNLASQNFSEGDFTLARSRQEEALAIAENLGDKGLIAALLAQLGRFDYFEGDYAAAIQRCEQSLKLSREVGYTQFIVGSLCRLGYVALRQGDLDGATTYFQEGLATDVEVTIPSPTLRCLAGLAAVAGSAGGAEGAARLFAATDNLRVAAGLGLDPIDRAEFNENMAIARARLDEEAWEKAWQEGWAMTKEQAVAEALQSPVSSLLTQTIDELQPRTCTAAQTGRSYPDDLTEREVDVLRLIAMGKSNQEIASELVLSVRTVERHISNIYQKLGMRGKARASATAYAIGRGLI